MIHNQHSSPPGHPGGLFRAHFLGFLPLPHLPMCHILLSVCCPDCNDLFPALIIFPDFPRNRSFKLLVRLIRILAAQVIRNLFFKFIPICEYRVVIFEDLINGERNAAASCPGVVPVIGIITGKNDNREIRILSNQLFQIIGFFCDQITH